MKKYYTIVFLLFSELSGFSQITVTQNDFANAWDTVLLSDAAVNQFLSYHNTGANSTWDFSSLQYNGQHVDTLFKETSGSPFYVLYFANLSINPHRSNVLTHGANTAPILPLLPLTITNTENFYYKSNSAYEQQGFGAQINGIPLPTFYSHPDVVYSFPLQFGNMDHSASGYSIDLPGTGYYGYQQTRTNTVDGWGLLTTPFGTFPVVRMVSEIASGDTFYINSVGKGIKIPRFKQREYKWIGNGQQAPLLQINTTVYFFNIEVISSILYRDSFHFPPPPPPPPLSGIDETGTDNFVFNVFPNPASGNFSVLCQSAGQSPVGTLLTVTDISGRLVMSKQLTETLETVDASAWEKGLYFVTVVDGNQRRVRKLVLQ